MTDTVRYDNVTYEYRKDSNYVILPDGRKILVAYQEELGNHGWIDLTSYPYEKQVSFAVEPINTRFPLFAIMTQDGKSVFLNKDYLDADTISNIKAVADVEQYDMGEYFSTDRVIKAIKINNVLKEIYCLDNNGMFQILDNTGDLLREIKLDLQADFIALDYSGSLLFYAGKQRVGVLSLTTYKFSGQIYIGADIKNIKVDFLNNLYIVTNDGLKIIDVSLVGDSGELKTIAVSGSVDVFISEIDNKIYLLDSSNSIRVYNRNDRTYKDIIKLSDMIQNAYMDYIAAKFYIVFSNYIIVLDTSQDVVYSIVNISDVIGIVGTPYTQDIYAIKSNGDMLHLFKDIKKKIVLSSIHGFESDDCNLYFFDDTGGVFKVFTDSYVPNAVVEVNRGRTVTGCNDITINLNLAEITNFPNQITVYENPEGQKIWYPASPLLYYSFSSETGDMARKLYVEITDKTNDDVITLTTPGVYISSRFADTRHPDDVVGLLKDKLLAANEYALKSDGNYGLLNLKLEVDSEKVTVGTYVTFKVYWIVDDLFKIDLTENSELISNNKIGVMVDNVCETDTAGTAFFIAKVFDVYSNSIKIDVSETAKENLVESNTEWLNHKLVLVSSKSSVSANEVITIAARLVSSDGTYTDFTDRVKLVNHFPDIAELTGSSLRGVSSGEAMITASISTLTSNVLKIHVSGTSDEIDRITFDSIVLSNNGVDLKVDQSSDLLLIGYFDGGSSTNITDEVDVSYQVLDDEIGHIDGYIFYADKPGTTPVVATYNSIVSNTINIDVAADVTSSSVVKTTLKDFDIEAEFKRGFIGAKSRKQSGRVKRLQADSESSSTAGASGDSSAAVAQSGGTGASGGGEGGGSRDIERAEEGGTWAENGLSQVENRDILPMTSGMPTSLEKRLSPNCIVIHGGGKHKQKVDGGNAPFQMLRSVKYCMTSVGLDFNNEAKVCIEIADGVNWHAFNNMDQISIWMKGPKPSSADATAQVNSGRMSNSTQYRDPALMEFATDYVEDKSLSYNARKYNIYKDRLYYDGVKDPEITPDIDILNCDTQLCTIIKKAFLKYKIPVEFIASGILTLSGLNRSLIKKKPIRRIGLMQITQTLAAEKGEDTNISNLLDPAVNIDVGCYFINKNRAISELDPVKMAAMYGVGSIILEDDTEWGVKEPEFGFITTWVNNYNNVIYAMKQNKLSF